MPEIVLLRHLAPSQRKIIPILITALTIAIIACLPKAVTESPAAPPQAAAPIRPTVTEPPATPLQPTPTPEPPIFKSEPHTIKIRKPDGSFRSRQLVKIQAKVEYLQECRWLYEEYLPKHLLKMELDDRVYQDRLNRVYKQIFAGNVGLVIFKHSLPGDLDPGNYPRGIASYPSYRVYRVDELRKTPVNRTGRLQIVDPLNGWTSISDAHAWRQNVSSASISFSVLPDDEETGKRLIR